MRALRVFFLCALVLMALIEAARLPWEAFTSFSGMQLGRYPIWSPPPIPRTEAFANAAVILSVSWDTVIAELLLQTWVLCVIVGVLYWKLCTHLNLLLHVVAWLALAWSAAVATSVGLWLVFGGWGPPGAFIFGGVGLVAGVILGFKDFYEKS